MIVYLKKVLSHSAYETFIASNDYITPNVIYDTEHIHYNPYVAPVLSITASVGDILWSDLSVTSTATPTGSGVIPIGICCIATGNTNTDDGKARFVSLKYMTSNGPSSEKEGMMWCPISSYKYVSLHSGASYEYTDYDGTGNTTSIVTYAENNYSGDNLNSFPAVNTCQSYAPTGTSAGDWYLPATQELKAVHTNKSIINSQLTALQANYSSDCMSDINPNYCWCSTEYGSDDAFYMGNGSLTYGVKSKYNNVLSMLKL